MACIAAMVCPHCTVDRGLGVFTEHLIDDDAEDYEGYVNERRGGGGRKCMFAVTIFFHRLNHPLDAGLRPF